MYNKKTKINIMRTIYLSVYDNSDNLFMEKSTSLILILCERIEVNLN